MEGPWWRGLGGGALVKGPWWRGLGGGTFVEGPCVERVLEAISNKLIDSRVNIDLSFVLNID